MKKEHLIILAALLGAGPLSASTILLEWGFDTDGDFEGWVDFQNRGMSTVAGGLFSGTAGGDVQIRTQGGAGNPLLLNGNFVDAGDYSALSFEVTLSQTVANSVSIGFVNKEYVGVDAENTGGLPVIQPALDQPVGPADTFVTLSWDVKSVLEAGDTTPGDPSVTDAVFRGIRFDPINVNAGYSIDSMRLIGTPIPEPSTSLLAGLAGLGLLIRRRK